MGRKNENCCRSECADKQSEAIVDARLDRMIEIADSEGLTLDHVVKYMGRCDQSTFNAFSDNPSRLPR